MKIFFIFIFLGIAFLGTTPFCLAASLAGQVSLKPAVKQGMFRLINKASDFHSVFQKKTSTTIKSEIAQTQAIIKDLYQELFKLSHIQQRIHLYKVLNSLESHLEVMKFTDNLDKPQQSRHIKELFRNFFEIVHAYNLKKKKPYYVFYCQRDKSVWFQSGKKPKNPISPNLKNCGRKIW